MEERQEGERRAVHHGPQVLQRLVKSLAMWLRASCLLWTSERSEWWVSACIFLICSGEDLVDLAGEVDDFS